MCQDIPALGSALGASNAGTEAPEAAIVVQPASMRYLNGTFVFNTYTFTAVAIEFLETTLT